MRRNIISIIFIASSVILLVDISYAGTIDKGTWSLGGSSNINFNMSDYDEDNVDDSNKFNFLIYGGYFVIDNFEIELGISFIREESDGRELKNYGLIPMINYHFPINERINFVSGIGIKWEKQEYNAGSYAEFDSFGYGLKVGFEFFLIPNAAITIDASYWKNKWNFDSPYDDVNENRFTIPLIGIKLYF